MKIIGIDPSTTCSGYALLDDGELVDHGIVDLKRNKNAIDRIENMIFELGDYIENNRPQFVYIEEPNGNNMKIARMISNVIGGIMYACYTSDAQFCKVSASEWRKAIGIPLVKDGIHLQRAQLKLEDIAWVKERYGFDCGDDEADAIGIANAAYLRQSETLFE